MHSTNLQTQSRAGGAAQRSLSDARPGAVRTAASGLLGRARAAGAALLESWVPLGYEDETGFHYGTPQVGTERRN